MSTKPVNVYSISEVSQRLDEEVPLVFSRLGYKESFKLIDTKLIIGYSIAIVAGTSFLLDKKLGHNNVIQYQTWLVATYAILSIAFWYFKKFVEKNVIYVGNNGSTKNKISFKREFIEGKPFYEVTLMVNDNETNKLVTKLEINKVFNENGYIQTELFFNWVKEQLESLIEKKSN